MAWPHPSILLPIVLVLFSLTFLRFYYVKSGLDSQLERKKRRARVAVDRYGRVHKVLTVLAPAAFLYTVLYAFVSAEGSEVASTFFVVTLLTCAHFLVHERYDSEAVKAALSSSSE